MTREAPQWIPKERPNKICTQLILHCAVRTLNCSINSGPATACRLDSNAKGLVYDAAEICDANECSIPITPNGLEGKALSMDMVEEEEAQVYGCILVPTREEPQVARRSLDDHQYSCKAMNGCNIEKCEIQMP